MSESRKGRRELSTSKRAAQNRAAQRAFRQRKEEYIKSLKDQVKDFEVLTQNYKAVQAENYQLRDYIINLQSRLLESQVDFQPPPSNIDLTRPRSEAGPSAMSVNQMQEAQLQAAAAQATAASELGGGRQRSHEEAQYLPGGANRASPAPSA
ncbi:hypothetical protein K402DRAFT_393201 [Aulographum hederae CBS 113979]|uniref:Putative transcription factor kapC n=1 Tax=Aulographum hederae CBS 113979 TaxID=1176131 RepID=A0A6G1H1W8_9PEZI|nr:hypothetical protein K402DRAFT_393201 [Aulographum hederae CBS 113979]